MANAIIWVILGLIVLAIVIAILAKFYQRGTREVSLVRTGLGGRSKLWLILGAWFVFCIGLFILFATTCDKPDDSDTPRSTVQRYKTSDEVHKVLRQDVERVTPDDRVYSVNVDDAREAYRTREDRYLYDRLLIDRNSNWVGWIEQRLDEPGTVFIAVGAGHLAGDGSVQDQLEDRGYTVTRVYE